MLNLDCSVFGNRDCSSGRRERINNIKERKGGNRELVLEGYRPEGTRLQPRYCLSLDALRGIASKMAERDTHVNRG